MKRHSGRESGRKLKACVAAIVAAVGLGTPCSAQEMPQLTPDQWREDVRALVRGLEENHRDAWNFTPREKVGQLADNAAAEAEGAEDWRMVVALQRIAAAIGDGHTFLAVSDLYSRFPIALREMEGRYYLVGAEADRAGLLGAELVRIGELPIAEATAALLPLVPRNENRWHEVHRLADLLTQAEPLRASGIVRGPSSAAFTFTLADGTSKRVRLRALPPSTMPELLTIGPGGKPVPVPPDRALRFDMLGDVAYLDFAGYGTLKEEGAALWTAVDAARPRAMIVDFRKNGGGSLPAGRDHLLYPAWERDQLNRTGCLYVLTGPTTFSAAMTNVTDFHRETEAITVGLPTGARPDGYQENKWFTLPNSGLRVSAAQRRYRFGLGNAETVMPDVLAPQTIADFREGRDSALDKALSLAGDCRRLDR